MGKPETSAVVSPPSVVPVGFTCRTPIGVMVEVTSHIIRARGGREPRSVPSRACLGICESPVTEWLTETVRPNTKYENRNALTRVVARLRIPPVPWSDHNPLWASVENWYEGQYDLTDNGERLLDVINVVIQAADTGYSLLLSVASKVA